MAGYISSDMLIHVVAVWWRGDALGIIFFTPIILLFSQKRTTSSASTSRLEKIAIWILSFCIGQIVLLGWVPSNVTLEKPLDIAWIFLLIIWASMRMGRRVTGLIQLMFLTQGLASAYFKVGFFAEDFVRYGLMNFWIFATLLATGGMMMAILKLENLNAIQKIKLVNDQLHTMIEAIPDAVFFKDGNGSWLVTNEAAKKLFKLHDIPWQGKTEIELANMRPEFRTAHETCLMEDEKTWKAGELTLSTETVIGEDGMMRDYEVRKMPVFSKQGDRQSLVIIGRDVTKQKSAETALRDSDLRWKFAIEGSGDGVWDWNIQTNEARYSKLWKEMLGYAEHDILPTNDEWATRIHPNDQTHVAEKMQAYLQGNSVTYIVEYRLRCKNHSYKWIMGRGMVVSRSDDGTPLRMIGTHTDITERKNADRNLRIAAIAFNSQEGMFVTDAKRNILRVNHAFTIISGYTADEAIGLTPSFQSSGHHDAAFYTDMWQSLNNTGKWEGEIWNRRKNGEVYPEYLTITAVTDNHGRVSNYVATLIDITRSKELEMQRLADEKTLRDTLVREVHHRIKNNLQGVAGLLRDAAALHPMLTESFTAAISQVRSIAVIHGLQGRDAMSNIQLRELITEIATNNELLWLTSITVIFPTNLPRYRIDEMETVPLALVLNELISNAVKHGGGKTGVNITLSIQPDTNNVQVIITNPGKLLSEVNTPNMPIVGTGLKLVKSLLPLEGANLAWEQCGNKVNTLLTLTQLIITQEQEHLDER